MRFKNKFKGESRYVNGETSSVFFLSQKMLITGSLTSEIRVQFPLMDTWLAYSPLLSEVTRSDSNGSAWRNVPLKQSLLSVKGSRFPSPHKKAYAEGYQRRSLETICLIKMRMIIYCNNIWWTTYIKGGVFKLFRVHELLNIRIII